MKGHFSRQTVQSFVRQMQMRTQMQMCTQQVCLSDSLAESGIKPDSDSIPGCTACRRPAPHPPLPSCGLAPPLPPRPPRRRRSWSGHKTRPRRCCLDGVSNYSSVALTTQKPLQQTLLRLLPCRGWQTSAERREQPHADDERLTTHVLNRGRQSTQDGSCCMKRRATQEERLWRRPASWSSSRCRRRRSAAAFFAAVASADAFLRPRTESRTLSLRVSSRSSN